MRAATSDASLAGLRRGQEDGAWVPWDGPQGPGSRFGWRRPVAQAADGASGGRGRWDGSVWARVAEPDAAPVWLGAWGPARERRLVGAGRARVGTAGGPAHGGARESTCPHGCGHRIGGGGSDAGVRRACASRPLGALGTHRAGRVRARAPSAVRAHEPCRCPIRPPLRVPRAWHARLDPVPLRGRRRHAALGIRAPAGALGGARRGRGGRAHRGVGTVRVRAGHRRVQHGERGLHRAGGVSGRRSAATT